MFWNIVVFLGACSYGVLSTIVIFAYDAGFTVDEVVGGQLLTAALLSWLLMLLLGRSKKTGNLGKKDWLSLLAVGVCTGLTGIFYYISLQYLSASIAIIMLFQFTWIGLLLESILTRKRPGRDELIALLLLLIGTVLASGVIGNDNHFSALGVLFGLLSAVSYALFIMFSGRAALQINSWMRNAVIMSGSLMISLIVFPPRFLFNGSLFAGLWKYDILLAIFVMLSVLCFNLGVPHIGATLAIILGSAELPTAVFMSNFILHESVSLLQWLGVGIILLGIALPQLTRRSFMQKEKEKEKW